MLSWGTPFVFKAYTRIGREASSGENEKTIRGKTKGKLMHITLQKKVKGENHCTWLKTKIHNRAEWGNSGPHGDNSYLNVMLNNYKPICGNYPKAFRINQPYSKKAET